MFHVAGRAVDCDELPVFEARGGVSRSHDGRYAVLPGDDGGVCKGTADSAGASLASREVQIGVSSCLVDGPICQLRYGC